MNRTHPIVTIALWGVLALAMLGVAIGAIWRHASPPSATADANRGSIAQQGTPLFAAPDLTLTDQEGRPFSTAALRGRPWVADFIFTTCAGQCPIMSHEMAELQHRTPSGVQLVSFTVDPAHDSAAVLKAYGAGLKADFARWHFLTGTPAEMAAAAYGMKISVRPANGAADPLVHSDRFLLVNASGQVVGVYDGTDAEQVKRLAEAAARLAGGSPS